MSGKFNQSLIDLTHPVLEWVALPKKLRRFAYFDNDQLKLDAMGEKLRKRYFPRFDLEKSLHKIQRIRKLASSKLNDVIE